ncbi:MAG: serine/threonine protein kinase [Candidatus Brocadiae bacterium]|nr:serine/threonine protein kinase [Candidatus Brocadiia bacterium]
MCYLIRCDKGHFRRNDVPICPHCPPKKLGKIVRELFPRITEEEIERARQEQRAWDTKNEHTRLLGHILQERGILQPQELQQVLAAQGIVPLVCNPCQSFFNCYGELPEKLPLCPQCQSPLMKMAGKVSEQYSYKGYLPKAVAPDSNQVQAKTAFPSRYRIESSLGKGGMGEVHKAFDTLLERRVALKIMDHKNISKEYIERFLIEKKMLANLVHPNIVKIYDFGREPQLYYTMEYLSGKTLLEAFPKGASPESATVAKVFQKISLALQYIHERGILHLDIKPSNIMIEENEGNPKLLDFGMAQIAGDISLILAGTKEYMSPEQAANQKLDARSDIYSLGVTLYEVLTGRRPSQSISNTEESTLVFASSIPKELQHICQQCVERKPEKRYQSAKQLSDALENFLVQESRRAVVDTKQIKDSSIKVDCEVEEMENIVVVKSQDIQHSRIVVNI